MLFHRILVFALTLFTGLASVFILGNRSSTPGEAFQVQARRQCPKRFRLASSEATGLPDGCFVFQESLTDKSPVIVKCDRELLVHESVAIHTWLDASGLSERRLMVITPTLVQGSENSQRVTWR